MRCADESTHPNFWELFLQDGLNVANSLPARPCPIDWQKKKWSDLFRCVMAQLSSYGPMIRDKNHLEPLERIFFSLNAESALESHDNGLAPSSALPSTFHGPIFPYILDPRQHASMRAFAKSLGIAWDQSLFLCRPENEVYPPPPSFTLPNKDRDFCMKLLAASGYDLQALIHAWRGQSTVDQRPSKTLDPNRVKAYLKEIGRTFPLGKTTLSRELVPFQRTTRPHVITHQC